MRGETLFNEGSEKESHDPSHPHWPMILVTWRSIRTQCSGSCCAPTARFIKLIRRKEGGKKAIKRDAIGPFSPFAPIRLSEAVCWNTNRLRLRPTTADRRAQLQLSSSVAVYWMEWFVGRMKQRNRERLCCPSTDLHVWGLKLQLEGQKGPDMYTCTSSGSV